MNVSKPMKLSKRLEMVAAFVPEGCRLADVGTDHGYVPIYLVQTGRAIHAVAMDVRTGPLRRAKAHIDQCRLAGQIEVRLSDGLKGLRAGEADTVVMAGIGGDLVIRILEAGQRLWPDIGTWVLSPQSELHKVRRYLLQQGFAIVAETMLCEDGKYYTVMQATYRGGQGPEHYREIDFLYGKRLLDSRHPALKDFLEQGIGRTEALLRGLSDKPSERAGNRQEELAQTLGQMKEALGEMRRNTETDEGALGEMRRNTETDEGGLG